MKSKFRSIYDDYKLRTNYVLTWLVSTARAANCPPDLVPPPASEQRTLLVFLIVPLAEWVEKSCSGALRVPRSILHGLDRMIALRQRYGQTLRGGRPPTVGDLRHIHLDEKAAELKIILQRLSATAAATHQRATNADTGAMTADFSALDIDECGSDEESDNEERQGFFSSVASDGAPATVAEEIYSSEEALFFFRLLLEDLLRLAAILDDFWDRYVAGRLDLAAVAAATDMALQLARHLEDEARIHLVKFVNSIDGDGEDSARKTVRSQKGKISKEQARTVVKDNIYLMLYQFLHHDPERNSQSATHDYNLEEKSFLHTFGAALEFLRDCVVRGARGARLSIKEGQHGSHKQMFNPSFWELSGDKAKEKMHKAFVKESLIELHFLGSLGKDAPIGDELSRRVCELAESQTVYISTVFLLHILTKIHLKLSAKGQSAEPLQTLRSFLSATSRKMSVLTAVLPTEESRTIISSAHLHLAALQRDIFRELQSARSNAGVITTTPFFTLLRHPVLCGLLLHGGRVVAQNAALDMERKYCGLVSAVHLGHVLKQEGLIPSLGALEGILRRQTEKSFFVGNRPTTRADYLKAYALAIGASITSFASTSSSRNGRPAQLTARKGKVDLAVPAPFSRKVYAHLRDQIGRFTLSEEDLIGRTLTKVADQQLMREVGRAFSDAASA